MEPVLRVGSRLMAAMAVAGLLACTSAPAGRGPASAISQACRAELQRAADALAGRPVLLSTHAFADGGGVMLQSSAQRTAGRILEPPERLELRMTDEDCTMHHVPSGRRQRLAPGCCRFPHDAGNPVADPGPSTDRTSQ